MSELSLRTCIPDECDALSFRLYFQTCLDDRTCQYMCMRDLFSLFLHVHTHAVCWTMPVVGQRTHPDYPDRRQSITTCIVFTETGPSVTELFLCGLEIGK